MATNTVPERNTLPSLFSPRWAWDDLFNLPWFENGPKSRLPEVFRAPMTPPVNMAENDKAFVVTLDMPGLDEKDIDVKLLGNQLVVAAERRWDDEKKGKEFHRVESQYGRFERSLTLPDNVKSASCEGVYKKGVLTITVPKVEPTPATKVNVRPG